MNKKQARFASTVNKEENGRPPRVQDLLLLQETLDFRVAQQEGLDRLSRAVFSDLEIPALLQMADDEIQKLLAPSCTRVLEWCPETGWHVWFARGWPETMAQSLLPDESGQLAAYAYFLDDVVRVDDFSAERRFRVGKDYGGMGSCIAAVIPGKARSWGVLEVAVPVGLNLDPSVSAFLRAFSTLLGSAIDRKTLAAEARLTDERMRLVMSTSRDGIWDWNRQTNEVYWNDRLYEILGLSRTQASLTAEDINALIHPEDLHLVYERLDGLIHDQTPCELEIRARHSSGRYKALLVRGQAIRNEQGEPVRMIGQVTDLSELAQADLKIQESESRFRSLADGIPLFIGLSDANGHALYYNKACQAFTGETSPELVAKNGLRYVHPDDVHGLIQTYQNAISQQKNFTCQYRIVGQNEEIRYLTHYGVSRFLPDGTFAGYVSLGLDVTEARRSLAIFQNLFESNMIGTLFWKADGTVTEANDALLDIMGQTREDVRTGRLNWRKILLAESFDEERIFAELAESGKGGPYAQQFVRPDGKVLDVLVGVALLEKDDLSQGVAFYVDITEQREAINRYKRIMESNMIGVVFTDWAKIQQCNDAFLNMLGYTRPEFEAGQVGNLWALTAPEDLATTSMMLESYYRTGSCKPFEKKYIHKDGHVVDVLVSVASLFDGDTESSIVLVSDISSQKRMSTRLQRLMDANLIGILYNFADGTIDECNDAFLNMLGYTRDDFKTGRLNFWDLTPPEDQHISRRAIESMRQTGVCLPYEKRYIHKDGHYVNVLVANATLPHEGHEAFLALVVDLSVQKRLTAKLQRIMDANLVGIVFAQINGDIQECNDVFLEMLGYSRAELHRGDLNFWALTPPAHQNTCAEAVDILKRDGFCRPFEKQYLHKDGHVVDALVALATMGPESTSDALAIVFDISDRKQAERALQQTLERERLNRNALEVTSQPIGIQQIFGEIATLVGQALNADRCMLMCFEPLQGNSSCRDIGYFQEYRSSGEVVPFDLKYYSPQVRQWFRHAIGVAEVSETPFSRDINEYCAPMAQYFRKEGLPEDLIAQVVAQYVEVNRDIWRIQSYVSYHIQYRGKLYGVLNLHQCHRENAWDEQDMALLSDIVKYMGAAFYQMELHQHEQSVMRELEKSYKLISIIREAQAEFIVSSDSQSMFRDLLNRLLAYTDSQYGLIGEVLPNTQGQLELKIRFAMEKNGNAETPGLDEGSANWPEGGYGLRPLCEQVMTTGQPVIFNALPDGAPMLDNFLGMPLYKGEEMVGLIGIAHRIEGYGDDLPAGLSPYLVACANIIMGVRNEALRERLTQELLLSEKALKGYASRLERSNKELEQFATIASHDLQAPLRKVILFSDYLKTTLGENLSEEGADYMMRIQKATRKMQCLITDLLALSRVNRKANPFVPVDLREVVEEALSDLEELIRETKAQVILGEFMTIDADGTQMHQVFQNLIGNALKFCEKGVAPYIEISARPVPEGLCEIRVTDKGIGFDEKYLDRIFAVFERLHGQTEYEGSGMGLAIVQKIAERHGGEITARSKPGAGATFIVTLPVHQA